MLLYFAWLDLAWIGFLSKLTIETRFHVGQAGLKHKDDPELRILLLPPPGLQAHIARSGWCSVGNGPQAFLCTKQALYQLAASPTQVWIFR